jgi:hypothetical protein
MVLASRIMTQRRTTVLLDDEVLATLGFEAKRRNVSVAELVREAVDARVAALRLDRRPRVGVARSTDGLTAAEVASEPIAEAPS